MYYFKIKIIELTIRQYIMDNNSPSVSFRKNIITNLNIISRDNFHKISQKIIALIDQISDEHEKYYNIYIDIFFNKAIDQIEDLYINLYTELCSKIFKHILSKDKERFLLFYRNIINKCQSVFESTITSDNTDKIKGCTILISNFINNRIINKELINAIITSLMEGTDEKRINILIALVSSFDTRIKLDTHIVDRLHEISQLDFSCSRVNILLEDIVDSHRQ